MNSSQGTMRRLTVLATTSVFLALLSPGVQAQASGASVTAESRIAKNWRARIIFKSGATQDLLWVGVSTDTFNQMRVAFWRYLNNEGPNRFNSTGPDGVQIAITWADVSAVTTWTD
ncbi:MAG: hypothetical protein JNN03_08525 [Rubrivivax sp.]|nr:hypothetical protein [Rubrivivax sp.]